MTGPRVDKFPQGSPVSLRELGPQLMCGGRFATPACAANSLTTCQARFPVTLSPHGLPALLTRRNTFPLLIPAASIHLLSSQ
jgi:hypothetical protein